MSQKIYDFVVIGSGLSGILTATTLSQFSKHVLLIEGQENLGGCQKKINTALGAIDNGFRFFPKTLNSESALQFLESILGIKLISHSAETHLQTYENGSMKPFVGFGENKYDFYEELSYFLHSEELKTHLPVHEWTSLLLKKFKGEILNRSIVTKFVSENETVDHIVINGTKTIKAKQFIFCGSFKDLSVLLPNDYLSSKAKSKLNKTVYWTAVGIDFVHSKTHCDNENIHVLNGTTQDEVGPCIGRFYKNDSPADVGTTNLKQISQWLTFIDEELSEDSEVAANALKKIKRQIKRAYPEALEGLVSERIFIYPNYSGEGIIKVNSNQSLPGLNNLWIGCGTQNSEKNMIGSILQAKLVLSSLGFSMDEIKNLNANSQKNDSELIMTEKEVTATVDSSSF